MRPQCGGGAAVIMERKAASSSITASGDLVGRAARVPGGAGTAGPQPTARPARGRGDRSSARSQLAKPTDPEFTAVAGTDPLVANDFAGSPAVPDGELDAIE